MYFESVLAVLCTGIGRAMRFLHRDRRFEQDLMMLLVFGIGRIVMRSPQGWFWVNNM